MLEQTTLYVEKGTDSMRSTLQAVGLALLVQQCNPTGCGAETRIEDRGSAYIISCNRGVDRLREFVSTRGLPVMIPALLKALSPKERKELEASGDREAIQRRYRPTGYPLDQVIDYEKEKARADAIKGNKKQPREEGDTSTRHPNYPLWAHLCSYFGKGSAMRLGYPLVLHAWHAHQDSAATDLFDLIMATYSDFPNDIEKAQTVWVTEIKPTLNYDDFKQFGWREKDATIKALSVISPTTVQGSFTSNAARTINTDTPEIFWLEMYLAFAGYMVVGMPYNADGDVLLYYPQPRTITVDRLRDLMEAYRNADAVRELYNYSNLFPRAKIDIISYLNFSREMIKLVRAGLKRGRFTPPNALYGIVGYYYKDISTQIPFDETTFALPTWLPDSPDIEALDQAESLLEAHLQSIRALRGDNADELTILDHYRHFAALGDPDDYMQFVYAYSVHRFRKLVDNPKLTSIKLEDFENTMKSASTHKDYRPILANPGFCRLADAINACTIALRYRKDIKKENSAFKVRHGLGDDLRRNAHNADQFVRDLSQFVHDYMRESASVQANTAETRVFITANDLADVVGLIAEYGSEVVANLLVAAGYSSRWKGDESAR